MRQGMIPFRLIQRVVRKRPVASTFSRSLCASSVPDHDAFHSDGHVAIGDIRVESVPAGSGRPDLVPPLDGFQKLLSYMPKCYLTHLRWMLQKDLGLKQDFLLLGPPSLARDRRTLLFMYAALVEREVEYVSLTRDTTDADLKQRKEVTRHGQESVYVNQAPVRAALEGRLLILDGLEKAERNVLPTLNNLLENRELSLDDGGLLVAPEVYDAQGQWGEASPIPLRRVHPDFRVAALASETAILDPPLRSRFQARVANFVDPGELLHTVVAGNPTMEIPTVQELVKLASNITGGVSLGSLNDAASFFNMNAEIVTPASAVRAYTTDMIRVNDTEGAKASKASPLTPGNEKRAHSRVSLFIETNTTKKAQILIASAFQSGNRAVALVGPKGSYKSALARQMAWREGKDVELFSLYFDMTARDLLMTRGTDLDGNTIWRKTPLTRAVERGSWVILDGIDKIGKDTLTSIALLLEQGQVDLPDGTRMFAHENFRCLALAHPSSSMNDWMAPEITNMFHWIQLEELPTEELKNVLTGLYPSIDQNMMKNLVNLRDRLNRAIQSGAADTIQEQESLSLSLRKMKHICRRLEKGGSKILSRLVNDALMTSVMPDREKKIVQACMRDCDMSVDNSRQNKSSGMQSYELSRIQTQRRASKFPHLIPKPVFEENPGQMEVLHEILDAHCVGERALLIMGFQGVGKNKVVDHALHLLQCEKEYLQLHRDTTAQSLLSSPSVENGRLVYGDSPLVRAAKYGRVLVVDEADKAPVEVVALMKGLIEDGELILPDGRILRLEADESRSNVLHVHPDFRVWALANPATYPFHGNDISGEMSDIFSCHTVPALDAESQRRILRSYGPNLSETTVDKIVGVWQDLRKAHEKGQMSYPFSVREAVSVVKHMNKFPRDGLEGALENVLAFDRTEKGTWKLLSEILSRHGLSVPALVAIKENVRGEGGISTPRTRTSSPKHGKVDEKNQPHVGGNTWAGGTGGSDTAGLGGRGGPYRLDAGLSVHQVTDEMKAQVSQEAQRQAREMAKAGLKKKLKELGMGKLDWDKYNELYQQVSGQIHQLQVLLKDLKRRKQERVWLRRQSTGELDDSRLVDALAGEKDCFKRRGEATNTNANHLHNDQPMNIKLVVDVSASMYRFNGYDGRLIRLLEATLMTMEALKDDKRFALTIVGHNGDGAEIPFASPDTSMDPATQLQILEGMIAHTQYTFTGDRTLEAIELAVEQAHEGDLILVVSDANLQRYRIEPEVVADLLNRKDVHVHLLFIGSLGKEAEHLARSIPNGRAVVCFNRDDLPMVIKDIVTAAVS